MNYAMTTILLVLTGSAIALAGVGLGLIIGRVTKTPDQIYVYQAPEPVRVDPTPVKVTLDYLPRETPLSPGERVLKEQLDSALKQLKALTTQWKRWRTYATHLNNGKCHPLYVDWDAELKKLTKEHAHV